MDEKLVFTKENSFLENKKTKQANIFGIISIILGVFVTIYTIIHYSISAQFPVSEDIYIILLIIELAAGFPLVLLGSIFALVSLIKSNKRFIGIIGLVINVPNLAFKVVELIIYLMVIVVYYTTA